MLFAADTSVQIAYIMLAGTIAAATITGAFGVVMAIINKRTNTDTGEKLGRSVERVSSFEDMALRYQRADRTREYFESRCDRQESQILLLRKQIIDAGMTPATGADA